MKKYIPGLVFSISLLIAISGGRWAQGLFIEAEFVHFSVNFPTRPGFATLGRDEVGGPWAMLAAEKWGGYPAGGILVWGREGEIVVDVGKQGTIKRLVQPRDVTLSTHWLRNVGARPRRIRLEFEMCGLPVEWETFERQWDETRKESTREIGPSKLFNMDWHLTLPPGWEDLGTICEGKLKVLDAHTDELLTLLPIKIVNSQSPPSRAVNR